MKYLTTVLIALALVVGIAGAAFAEVNDVTPSTNEINKTKDPKWAHVNQISQAVGSTEWSLLAKEASIAASNTERMVTRAKRSTRLTTTLTSRMACIPTSAN